MEKCEILEIVDPVHIQERVTVDHGDNLSACTEAVEYKSPIISLSDFDSDTLCTVWETS